MVHRQGAQRRKLPPGGADQAVRSEGERLQKVLAAAGVGSRRQCEELITMGRVEVDRRVVTELGTRVDADNQEIRVDGELIARQRPVYYALNKPQGVITTNRDPSGRPRVVDLIAGTSARLFPVGRLDLESDGLILLTNDGALAEQLTHPRYGVQKTYRVLVAGLPAEEELDKLRRGVHLAEGVAKVDRITIKSRHGKSTVLEIVLSEGRNREVRRILAKIGHKVMQLTRVAVGPVRLGKLSPGAWRRLTAQEVDDLRHSAQPGRRKPPVRHTPRPRPSGRRANGRRAERLPEVEDEIE
jgi:23S rRNA pseudouridine2605 synthase